MTPAKKQLTRSIFIFFFLLQPLRTSALKT